MMFPEVALVPGPAAVPAAWAQAAKAKLERDRKSYAAFRAVDQQQHDRVHEQRVTSAAAVAEDEVACGGWTSRTPSRKPRRPWPRSGPRRTVPGRRGSGPG